MKTQVLVANSAEGEEVMDCAGSARLKDKAQPDGCCRYVDSNEIESPSCFLLQPKGCQAWQPGLFINKGALT